MSPIRTLNPYPLDDIAVQFRSFIERATTSAAFYVGSVMLRALSQEASARALYTDAWKEYDHEQDGMSISYTLCAALGELAEASQGWAQVARHLEKQLQQESDDYLLHLRELSIHNFQRVSFLQFGVQNELQDVAKMHKVLLAISVLEVEDQEGVQDIPAESLERSERS
ncbi:MAG TPA: hypothetical protein VFA10_10935 [Ktedonobacteraceae bacterium]|nr:hypothetical protein [Ktedonobacteraceae bacterium]